jgi:protein-arginine kinase activator protein McsA
MMIDINYQKRKNSELFKSLEEPDSLFLSKTQNYIPIYKRFFTLNDTNYNNVNLNHKLYISSVNKSNEDNKNLFNCRIKNINNTNKNKDKNVFFKMAPLLDPFKYLIGKYNTADTNLLSLPSIDPDENACDAKILDLNNSAYVDGLFVFLNSYLLREHNFYHCVDYYGSFLAIKNNFVLNVFDDIDYLNNSDYFNKNKNVLFSIDDYDHLFQFKNEPTKLKPIKIQHNSTARSNISLNSLSNDVFENIFDEDNSLTEVANFESDLIVMDMGNININNITNETVDDLTNETQNNVTLKSNSTCSSRTSYTLDGEAEDDIEDCENCDNCNNHKNDEDTDEDKNKDTDDDDDDNWEDEPDQEERIDVIIPKFPVQVICMEYCENTFDDLILSNELTNAEWYSAFMQIIMILITYQKAFSFTHNDLHSNNVMYNTTDKKYIYYCYKKQYYKVPTFGRIFKIIDFGRSIYKFNGKLFCSDSFKSGNDAATQYNTEPYFNEKKSRLEPNFSFDLCRLACSIYDYVIEDFEDVKHLETCDPVKRLVFEWCLDDKGINMLYKNNGVDRYPDFKLYKMIARCVHKHTPQAQLDRPEFKAFSDFKGEVPNDFIDIDKIPVYN